MIPAYKTLAEKAPFFESVTIDDINSLHSELAKLKSDGYFFRGQADASWKLFTAIQRDWLLRSLNTKFGSINDLIQEHLKYQRHNAANHLSELQQNDLSILSTLQHYGAPTPFLDFTSEPNPALYFATENASPAGADETSQFVSIYAWKPGLGPATSRTNDMWNWEKVIDMYGATEATSLTYLQEIPIVYIKQDSGAFLHITNKRLDLQNGLFVYAAEALTNDYPYEALFNGKTMDDIAADDYEVHSEFFIPKLVCLNISKLLIPAIRGELSRLGIDHKSLGLNSESWAREHYEQFLQIP